MTHPDTPTFTCLGCGRITPDDDNGCLVCDLCATCTPNAGNCLDCADMRRENHGDFLRDYRRENEFEVPC
jgi:hypothetical protein